MNDLDICKRLAEIEGVSYFEFPDCIVETSNPDGSGTPQEALGVYNPLTDDALWLRLIFKFEISISFVFCKVLMVKGGVFEKNFTGALSLKRNALLLIIEAHKDS